MARFEGFFRNLLRRSGVSIQKRSKGSISMLANPVYRSAKSQPRRGNTFVFLSAVILLALVVAIICGWLMLETVASYYAHRIYPNVYVLGLNLGRLTREEAAALLQDAARRTDMGVLILRDVPGDVAQAPARWSVPWSEAGLRLDVPATVEAALTIGHADDLRMRERVRVWLRRHDVAPVSTVDREVARATLEALAPSLYQPPTDATLRLEGEQVVAVPGQAGRELDVEMTLTRLLAVAEGRDTTALAAGNEVTLAFQEVPPRVTDVGGVQAQAQEMLARRILLSAYDVLTDETFSWELGRRDFVAWLQIDAAPDGPTIEVTPKSIQTTLSGLAAGLGQGRGLRLEEAAGQVLQVFQAGGGHVDLYLTHPQRDYVVQPGDTLSSIAATFGMTPWHIVAENPSIDPDWLNVGQQLLIPSQDVLTPYLPVPNKRVTVSIAEQRMRAYQDGELVFDWPVSTGMEDSPTHTGVFQMLNKEKDAYASLWDLWMPHFIAIYAAGPNFHNGFHGLPTLSSGRRLWEGLLGSPASYGCIILGLEEAETFYEWAEVGVVVVIEIE